MEKRTDIKMAVIVPPLAATEQPCVMRDILGHETKEFLRDFENGGYMIGSLGGVVTRPYVTRSPEFSLGNMSYFIARNY
ncbi:hypothetical protein J6590_007605 [Homalodisca vitripennis]|nr:hypothetical protein J6590_007605 [Homalodisca vitripennis]